MKIPPAGQPRENTQAADRGAQFDKYQRNVVRYVLHGHSTIAHSTTLRMHAPIYFARPQSAEWRARSRATATRGHREEAMEMPLRAVLEEVRPAGRTVPQLAPALLLLRSVPPLSTEAPAKPGFPAPAWKPQAYLCSACRMAWPAPGRYSPWLVPELPFSDKRIHGRRFCAGRTRL